VNTFRVPHGSARDYADLLVAAGFFAEAVGKDRVRTDAHRGARILVREAVKGPFSLVARNRRRVWLVEERIAGLARAKDDARTYALAHGGKDLVVYIVDRSSKAIGAVTPNPGHYIPLTPNQKVCASKYISEEVATRKYARAQAVAIGLSRARKECP
jgi:hypothetical protein